MDVGLGLCVTPLLTSYLKFHSSFIGLVSFNFYRLNFGARKGMIKLFESRKPTLVLLDS